MNQVLPDSFLRRMKPEDRAKQLGKAGRTADECREVWQAGEEKKLQGLIANFLNLRDIYFETDAFGRKTSGKRGRPDFRVCYRGKWLAVECKAERGVLSKEQQETLERIRKSGGVSIVAFGLPAVQEALRKIDEEMNLNPLTGATAPASEQGGCH